MVAFAAAAAALKIPAVLKNLGIGKLLFAAYMASTASGAYGQQQERKLSREQMKLQALSGKASAEATKRGVKESRTRTKEYIDALLKAKKEEAKETREFAALQSFTQSQDRQMALVMRAMQAMSQRQMGASTQASGAGMLGLMRGGL